jgi:hypothetical protein
MQYAANLLTYILCHYCFVTRLTAAPIAPVCPEVKVTIVTGTAKKAGTATAAVPLSYSQLYEVVEKTLQLTVEDFELRLHKDSIALDTDWSWHTSSPLTIHVSPCSDGSILCI